MHGTVFVQNLREDKLATNYNYVNKFIILKWKRHLSATHIDKLRMNSYYLANIDQQVSNEDLTFTILGSLPPSFHTFVVSFNTPTDQLFMKLACGQLL
jgi:hypothetical protein